jgi:methanethiol S-methyltransferase
MHFLERTFVWLGAGAFVLALAATGYSFLVLWQPGLVAANVSWTNAAVDAALFAAFAAHHSIFARAGIKAHLARAVPDRLIRAIYVWTASLLLLAVLAWWQPVGGLLYRISGAWLLGPAVAQVAGVLLIARSVRVIDALDLAGVRDSAAAAGLQVRGPYRFVRHPLYLGWVLVVCGTAAMTGDRLAFAVYSVAYLIVAVPWEERSLRHAFGAEYVRYSRRVRWRIVPYVY